MANEINQIIITFFYLYVKAVFSTRAKWHIAAIGWQNQLLKQSDDIIMTLSTERKIELDFSLQIRGLKELKEVISCNTLSFRFKVDDTILGGFLGSRYLEELTDQGNQVKSIRSQTKPYKKFKLFCLGKDVKKQETETSTMQERTWTSLKHPNL